MHPQQSCSHLNALQILTSCHPQTATHLAVATGISHNCHQYFTQTLTAGQDLMQLRKKNQKFSNLTDHNSAATIHHGKRWDLEGKFLTGIWLIAVCTDACWVWAIRKRKLYIQVKCVFYFVVSLVAKNKRHLSVCRFVLEQYQGDDSVGTHSLDFSVW